MKLYNILKKCNTVFTIINPQNFDISGLTYDSRCVKNNFIFSCIQGKNFCGTKFIKDLIHYKKITIFTKSQTKGLKFLNNEFKKKITIIMVDRYFFTFQNIDRLYVNYVICLKSAIEH